MVLLEDHDILAFTFADWRASWSTPQQLMSRFAPQNRVLYVDQPRSFLYGLRPKDPQGAGVWSGPALQEVEEKLFVYHMPHCFLPVGGLPFPLAKLHMILNGQIMTGLIRRQLKKLGMSRPILWNFSPLHGKAAQQISSVCRIYDICDEWVNYIENASGRAVVEWIEGQLCRQSDLLFVGTENGKALRAHLNPEIVVVPHAADYAHFARAALPETAVPEDIAALPQPVIGSVGVLDPARFDVDRILYLARERPGWSIALVGPARADMDLSRLEACPNVYLLGNKALAELPGYIKGMAVTLIPYLVNEATRNIYPLKLQEYLASGKPVVSSAMPSVLPYGDVVRIAERPESCLAAVEACLAGEAAGACEKRQAVARANSWEERVAQKRGHIERILKAKSACEQGAEGS